MPSPVEQTNEKIKSVKAELDPYLAEEKLTKMLLSLKKFTDEALGLTKKMDDGKFKKGVKELGKTFKSMLGASVQGALLEMLFSILGPTIELLGMFSPIFEALGLLIMSVFLPVMKDLMPYIILLTKAIISLVPYASMLYGILKDGIIVVFKELWRELVYIWNGIVILWNGLVWAYENILKPIFDGIVAVWKWLVTQYKTYLVPLFEGIGDLFVWIVSTVSTVFGAIGKGFEAAGDVIEGIIKGAKNIINVFINAINFAIGVINNIPGVNIKKIPKLAKGGIAVSPTLAMIGEGGRKEAVVPLDRANEMGFGGDPDLLYTMIQVNDNLIAIRSQNEKMTRMSGRRVFG